MRFYGLPASEEHSADMLQLRLSRLSRIERRPGPGLADNIPCYHLAITNGALHDMSSLRLPTSLLHHTIPPQQLQPVFRSGSYTQVFIVSNIPLAEQYSLVQLEEPVSYAAFLRRINDGVWEMLPDSADETL